MNHLPVEMQQEKAYQSCGRVDSGSRHSLTAAQTKDGNSCKNQVRLAGTATRMPAW